MRILASSDLHYNIPRSQEPTRELAKQVINRQGDVLILAGDIAGVDITLFAEALELFSGFKGIKLLVPGNHDLWVNNGISSLKKWQKMLPLIADEYDFIMLDGNPQIIGDIGFAGNIGWYDYSFRDESLNVPIEFYQAKIGPGRALYNDELGKFNINPDELDHIHRSITGAWNDRKFVKLEMSDSEFTALLADRLKKDIETIYDKCEKMVTVTHHLSTRELVWYRGDPNWDFSAAFLGSQLFADIVKQYPKIVYHLTGHNHKAARCKISSAEHIAIGSTYKTKALIELDI